MRRLSCCWLVLLTGLVSCGEQNGGSDGPGGSLEMQSTYRLSCTIDSVVLELPIELHYGLDSPYVVGRSVELSYSATVGFSEEASSALIAAGVSKIDIISMSVETRMNGARPETARTSLAAAPINDFDLEPDTDDNGAPGPHRLELETIVVTSQALEGATEVELGLGLDGISILLGDFQVPNDCIAPSLVGFSSSFPVGA